MPGRLSAASRALLRLRDALKRIQCIREKLPGFDWCHRAVLLGLAANLNDADAAEALRNLASWREEDPPLSGTESIVLLCGGCSAEVQSAVDAFKPLLLRACEAAFVVRSFAAARTAGVSGLAGDLAEQSAGRVRAFGYLPRLLPRGVQEDLNPARYARLFNSAGSDFSPLEPLQGWTDILAAGVNPRRVKLLSYGGGQISRAECALALALGARVGVVEDATLPKDRQFNEPEWQDCPNLVRLPLDTMTLRAFLLVDELSCEREEFAAAAQRTHEDYVKTAIPKEPSLLPWKNLPQQLKVSNFHHVAYAENILKTVGLGLRPVSDPDKPLVNMAEVLSEEEMNRLAEMEHGRWNVERLLHGWRYAEMKDVGKKLSPYLVPWETFRARSRNTTRTRSAACRPASGRPDWRCTESRSPRAKDGRHPPEARSQLRLRRRTNVQAPFDSGPFAPSSAFRVFSICSIRCAASWSPCLAALRNHSRALSRSFSTPCPA